MNSRFALSALFILIAAIVLASQGTGLLKKFEILQTSWADKISEARPIPVLDFSSSAGTQARTGGTTLPGAKIITFSFPDATHCLGSQVRHLQRFVVNLFDSDHQGE